MSRTLGATVDKRTEQRLGDLYWRYAGEGLRLAFLLTGDQHAAQDIVHDAFVRLFGRFQDLRSSDKFETYFRRTIVNLSRDRFRKLRLEREYVAQTDSASQLGVESSVEDRELIRGLLRSLPDRQRAAIVLRYYVDLSEQDTATVLECSVPAVKSLVSRATASLSKRIGGEVS